MFSGGIEIEHWINMISIDVSSCCIDKTGFEKQVKKIMTTQSIDLLRFIFYFD